MTSVEPFEPSQIDSLRKRLHHFLEIHTGSRISDVNNGALVMLIRHAKTKNTKIKDKMINYKLSETSKRLLVDKDCSYKDFIICEFLVEELEKYVSSKL